MTASPPLPMVDGLEIVVVVDNETDTLSTVDNPNQLPESARLVVHGEPIAAGDATGVSVLDHLCGACHGFSAVVTARLGDRTAVVLFDVGPDGDLWLANAARLGIDLTTIELVFLSHWHWDHSGGFERVVAAISEARRANGLARPIVDVHPDRPTRRASRLADGRYVFLPPDPELDALERAGGEVVANASAHLLGGLLYGSGEIARVTPFETGLVGHCSLRGDRFEPDPLILDERYVAVQVQGRGVTVLSACSHAGIVNVALDVTRTFGASLDLVLGGYHLAVAAWRSASPRPSMRCSVSNRCSSHQGTAPVGGRRQHWPAPSHRPVGTPRASSGPVTASEEQPEPTWSIGAPNG